MHELIISDDFKRYHRKLIQHIAFYIWGQIRNSHYIEAKGAMELAQKIVKFPLEMSNGDDVKQFIMESIKEFEVAYIKAGLDS